MAEVYGAGKMTDNHGKALRGGGLQVARGAQALRRRLDLIPGRHVVRRQVRLPERRRSPSLSLHCAIGRPQVLTEGWSQLLCNEMEVRKLIGKPLKPARPIRRVDNGSLLIDFHAECDSFKEDLNRNYSLRCSPSKLNGLVHEAQIPKSSKKSEEIQSKCNEGRITYSRDDLLQLSSSSVSRVKPKYLPDHPVILQHPCSDLLAGPMSPTIHPS